MAEAKQVGHIRLKIQGFSIRLNDTLITPPAGVDIDTPIYAGETFADAIARAVANEQLAAAGRKPRRRKREPAAETEFRANMERTLKR